MYRVASVSFLNALPLVEGLREQDGHGVLLIRDLPSLLLGYLNEDRADVALLPTVEILRGVSGGMLPVAGICCRGAVDSVKLFSASDPGGLRGVAVDRGSRSSVALLKVLMAEMYGRVPGFRPSVPTVGSLPAAGEGLLVIGDRCFEYEKFLREQDHKSVRSWDLGQLWWDLTGLPFVFATWALAPRFREREGERGVSALRGLLSESLRSGLARRHDIAVREAGAGRLGRGGHATVEAIDYYFNRSLRFTVEDEELAGVRRFHELAAQHGVIPAGPMPEILRGQI